MSVPDNSDPTRPPSARDGHAAHLFGRRSAIEPIPVLDAASTVVLPIEILKENYEELLRVIEANEWERDEGLTTVLLAGLGLQKGLLQQAAVSDMVAHGDAHASKRVDEIVQELAAYHSMYSVMKFKAFKLYKLNQTLEFNNSGLRAQEVMWQEWADRMREERATLNAELVRLRALLSEFKLDWDDSGAPPLPPGVFASLRMQQIEAQVEEPSADPSEADVTTYLHTTPPAGTPSFWTRVRKLFGG